MKLDKFETTPFHCEMGGDSKQPYFLYFLSARSITRLFFTFKSDSLRRVSASRICA